MKLNSQFLINPMLNDEIKKNNQLKRKTKK